MKKTILAMACIATILYLSACKKGDIGDPGAIGPKGPVLKGSLAGNIFLFDQYGTKIPVNLQGVTVSIEGSTLSAITDSLGKWHIDSLSTGVYTLNFSKAGYALAKNQSLQFVGGGTVEIKNTSLLAVPSYQLSSTITAKDSVGIIAQTADTIAKGIVISGTYTSNDTRPRSAVIFVNKTNAVSSLPSNYIFAEIKNPFPVDKKNPNGTNFSIFISADELHNAGFKKGDTVYFIAYSAANGFNTLSNYQDYNTGRVIYNAIGNPSIVINKTLSY
jgi:hypothetical protein